MKANIKKFRDEIDSDITNVKNILRKAAYSAAYAAIDTIIDRGKVWSGSFVMSNRIGIDEVNNTAPSDLKRYDPTDPTNTIPIKCTEEEALMVRQKAMAEAKGTLSAKRKHIKPYGKINITNDISYALEADSRSGETYLQALRIAEEAAKIEFELVNSIDKKTHL